MGLLETYAARLAAAPKASSCWDGGKIDENSVLIWLYVSYRIGRIISRSCKRCRGNRLPQGRARGTLALA